MLIPFQELKQKYPHFKPKGVVHVGASEGQELEEYHRLGINKMIWIEAIPSIYEVLVKRTSPFPDVICFNEGISDRDWET